MKNMSATDGLNNTSLLSTENRPSKAERNFWIPNCDHPRDQFIFVKRLSVAVLLSSILACAGNYCSQCSLCVPPHLTRIAEHCFDVYQCLWLLKSLRLALRLKKV